MLSLRQARFGAGRFNCLVNNLHVPPGRNFLLGHQDLPADAAMFSFCQADLCAGWFYRLIYGFRMSRGWNRSLSDKNLTASCTMRSFCLSLRSAGGLYFPVDDQIMIEFRNVFRLFLILAANRTDDAGLNALLRTGGLNSLSHCPCMTQRRNSNSFFQDPSANDAHGPACFTLGCTGCRLVSLPARSADMGLFLSRLPQIITTAAQASGSLMSFIDFILIHHLTPLRLLYSMIPPAAFSASCSCRARLFFPEIGTAASNFIPDRIQKPMEMDGKDMIRTRPVKRLNAAEGPDIPSCLRPSQDSFIRHYYIRICNILCPQIRSSDAFPIYFPIYAPAFVSHSSFSCNSGKCLRASIAKQMSAQ